MELRRSPFVVGMVIGSLALWVFALRAQGRVEPTPPTVIISEAPLPDFDPEQAMGQVLSLGFGLAYRPGEMGLALVDPPEQGVLDLLVVDQASPQAPVAVGTLLNPHAYLLPGMAGGFELPGMDDAASGPAQQMGMTVQFSIMAGLVVTPQWDGAVCVLAAQFQVPNPTGGTVNATVIQPLAIAGDLAEAIDLAQRIADLFNGVVPEASWQESGPVLNQSQSSCFQNCMAVYHACRELALARLEDAIRGCEDSFMMCMLAVGALCYAVMATAGPLAGKLCFIVGLAACLLRNADCRAGAKNMYLAELAMCKANLRACLGACGIELLEH